MRLKKDQQAMKVAAARGFQGGADFGGVMAVVVDEGDAVKGSPLFRSGGQRRKMSQALADEVGRDVQM